MNFKEGIPGTADKKKMRLEKIKDREDEINAQIAAHRVRIKQLEAELADLKAEKEKI